MKRWMPVLLIICIALLLPAVSVAARAADTSGTCGDDLTWTFDEATGTLTIEGTGPMWDWDWDGMPWYTYRSDIKRVTIGNGVTSIEDYSFYGCSNLLQITIPNGITFIGDYAFYNCQHLTQVAIPYSVTTIGHCAFDYCKSLTAITVDANNVHYCSAEGILFDRFQTVLIKYPAEKQGDIYAIPDSVTSIEDYAFYSCQNLTQVTIPSSVTSIGDYAFSLCTSLTAIIVDEYNIQYASIDGVLFDKFKVTLIWYPANKQGEIYTIPDSVTSIGAEAFRSCTNLIRVTIPNSVSHIGSFAFYNCTDLTRVTIPNSVTSIGDYTFSTCWNLTQVTIPDSITAIGDSAFYFCDNLTDVYYKGKKEQWNAITVKSGNDPLLNATIHYAFWEVPLPALPEEAENALIAAYGEGKLLCTVTGQVGNDNYIPLANQPDEIRIFYLGDNYQPVTAPDIIPLD